MKSIAAVVAAVLGIASSSQANAGKVLDRVLTDKVMVMSTDPDYPPQSSLDDSKTFVGFDIDVGREIARRLDVGIRFVTPGWEVITAGNWKDRWDISVGSMTPTAARSEMLEFPAVYYYTPAALAVHADNAAIDTPRKAKGATIGVGISTTYESYLKRDLSIDAEGAPPFKYQIEGADIRVYDTDQLALDDLRLGDGARLQGVITALPTILAAIKRGYPLKVVGGPLFFEPLSVAVDKGDAEWSAKLREIIEGMRKDGTLTRLSNKWYGADLTQ